MPTSRWQPAFAAGVLGPALHGRMDLDKYDIGLKVGENVIIHAHGGVSNRAGTEYIGASWAGVNARMIPFERSATENYILLLGNNVMRVIRDGAFVMSGGSQYFAASPFAASDLPGLDYAQSIDVMYFAHGGVPRKLLHYSATSWAFDFVNIVPSTGRVSDVYLSETNSTESASPENEFYTYTVSAVINGVEGYPAPPRGITVTSLDYRGSQVFVQWPTVAGAEYYNVYKKRGGSFGYIGYSPDGTTGLVDDNINADMTVAPIEEPDFLSDGSYPTVVGVFQQRLIYANAPLHPETIWFSQLGDYENFSKSEIMRATDSFEMDITGQSLNRIKGLLPLRELLVFGAGGEWSLTGPDGGISATNTAQRQFGYSGLGDVKPVVVEDTAIFVDRSNRNVRDLRYAFEQDGYSGNDLTIFAYHYFDGREVVSWAYQKVPHSIVWVALDNGDLLSFTYKREHQVWAWSRHDMGGLVKDVAVIREGSEDRLYLLIERVIGGSTVRYIERMASRLILDPQNAFFVDCGVKYEVDPAQTTFTSPAWLLGATKPEIAILADGEPVEDFTINVGAGTFTLPTAASTVIVGLKYTSEIETLPPGIELQDVGNARGRPIKASKVYLQVENTRGIKVGPTRDRLHEYEHTTSGLYSGTVQMGVYPDWNRDGTVVVRQEKPLPMTILGIAPDYSIGRTSG